MNEEHFLNITAANINHKNIVNNGTNKSIHTYIYIYIFNKTFKKSISEIYANNGFTF